MIRAANEKLAADAAARQDALTEKIKADAADAETRIEKARAEAIENIQSVSVEVARVATSRLIGTEVPAEEAEAAVTAAIQGRS